MSEPISKLIHELDKICAEFSLEKKACSYRFCGPREHGYLRAYEIYKERKAAKWN